MARIALTWELGASYGHATAIVRVGDALRSQGHDVAIIVRELKALQALPESRALEVFQAPVYVSETPIGRPRTYAEILTGMGYRDENTLAGILGAWHALLQGWKPELVVADYSPTALLAARALGIKRATFGNGFFTPPGVTPLPAFRNDVETAPGELERIEADVLANVNGALARFGAPPLERLAQQFEATEDFLCTFPELDHYGARAGKGYWGPRLTIDRGRVVDWPEGPGKRVLVYLPAALPPLDELFAALRSRGHNVVAYIYGLEEARRKAYASARIRVSEGPVRVDRLLARCDLMVSLGGDIAVGTFSHGIPQLLFPSQFEQHVVAMLIERQGGCVMVRPPATAAPGTPAGVDAALDRVLNTPSYALAARAFRQRYPAWTPAEQLRRVVVRIGELVAA